MRVKISNSIPAGMHDEIRDLIGKGFRGIVSGAGVEVHVKATPIERTRDAEGCVSYYVSGNRRMSGRTYYGIPGIARVAKTSKDLVTLHVPADPTILQFPYTHKYPGLKTAPEVTFENWRQELLHLAAHEAYHVRQCRRRGSQSEVRADKRANQQLARFTV